MFVLIINNDETLNSFLNAEKMLIEDFNCKEKLQDKKLILEKN